MITPKNITLEEVCTLTKGFENSYDAVKYFYEKKGEKIEEMNPKKYVKWQSSLLDINNKIAKEKPVSITKMQKNV